MTQNLLWDAAVKEHELREADRGGSRERTIMVVGNKQSGKTSLLLRFMERPDESKPTTGLDYLFFRRSSGHNLSSDVTHMWELAGGGSLVDLIDVPMKPGNIGGMCVVMVLDLSKPEDMWDTFNDIISKIRETVQAVKVKLKEDKLKSREVLELLQKNAWGKFGKNHPDKEILAPLEIPLVIIANKYDIFVKLFDVDKRKIIGATLRFLAHIHGASLLYTSCKSEGMILRMKTLLNHVVYGSAQNPGTSLDYERPLVVPAGVDNLGKIGPPVLPAGSDTKIQTMKPLEFWRYAFDAQFPQTAKTTEAVDDKPAVDPQFAEPVVDQMRAQKDQELIKYKQATEKAAKEQERRAKMSGATQPGDKSTGGAAAGAAPSKSSSKTTKHGSSSSSTERTKAGRSKNH